MEELRRNKPHYAIDKEIADKEKWIIPSGASVCVELNDPNNTTGGYKLEKVSTEWMLCPIEQRKTLYDGRYCAVAAFIFAIVDGKLSVLANQRGKGTPDFQGYWNCPCGFLERNEFGYVGAARETLEETGFHIRPDALKMFGVQTDPYKSNNGNVTIRYKAFVGFQKQITSVDIDGGEADEVERIKWIPLDEVGRYQWAFGHEKTIFEAAPSKWESWIYAWAKKFFERF